MARAAVLVVNAGSSSVKFSVFEMAGPGVAGAPRLVTNGEVEAIDERPRFAVRDRAGRTIAAHRFGPGESLDHDAAIAYVLAYLDRGLGDTELVAAGHRVVHGGTAYRAPVRIDARVMDALQGLVPLAPLHQPHNLAAIRALADRRPALPQVACFDTAFHQGMPEIAAAYALPTELTARGVRRYGFHGLSYEYIASVLPQHDPAVAAGRTVVAHLGNGASMCALRAGRSIASTMGFTALDGLPMGTRSGALDPGVVLYLMDQCGMDARGIEDLLYHRAGLLGVSGLASDMRTLLASDDPRARFAIDLFVYRIGRELGSLAAALGGLDALVFTGGIGEHAVPIRSRVLGTAAWLGFTCDEAANGAANRFSSARISTAGAAPSAWVIPTEEELMIARHTAEVL